ncbi:odorant receptor 67d-like [Malaya genurostris]|uniref:odorant receptor 67d-like n=1 Tax=Malaya genurostris TaxID=325434 RepID=UPI0026F3B375|nr:odorant receptor 67d-like [Malaya genurostris]
MSFLNRLQRFRLYRHSFTNPAEFAAELIAIPTTVAKLHGSHIFSSGFTAINRYMVVSSCYMMLFSFMTFITAYEMRNDSEGLIFALVTFGTGIQCLGKLCTFLYFRKNLYWMHSYTLDLYKEECNPRTKTMLMNRVFLLSVILKTMLVSYVFTSAVMIGVPVFYSWKFGEKILPFGFYVPYVNHDTWSGYLLNYVVHIIATSYAFSASYGGDGVCIILLMSSFIQIDLLIASLKEVNQQLEANGKDVGELLKKIIQRHQEHLKFFRNAEDTLCSNFLLTFSSLATVLVLSFYAVLVLSWYQGYVFIGFVSYQLLFCCFMGTVQEMKNEQLEREIYNFTWYKLPISQQKSLLLMLQRAQNPIPLTLIFGYVNMPTFLQIYKTIYSVFAMLLRVQEE